MQLPSHDSSQALRSQTKLVLGTSLAIGLHLALAQGVMTRSFVALPVVILGSGVFGLFGLALWRWLFPRLEGTSRRWRFVIQCVAAVTAMAAASFIAVNLPMWVAEGRWMFSAYEGGDIDLTIPASTIQSGPFLYFIVPILPAAIIVVVGFNQSWWRILQAERRANEARALAAQAQLEALRAQIHPHFLFNSLNSIAQLITSDPTRAEACVERLSEILRYLLHSDRRSFVTLGDELEIADAYLDIERARFGNRLRVDYRVSDAARGRLVPTLILQPLIENAVRHGIAEKIGGGRVSIEAALERSELSLVVRDTGVGLPRGATAALSDGVGLRNVHDRLVQLFGEEYAPVVDSEPGAGTSVRLRVPLDLESRTAQVAGVPSGLH